MWKEGRKDETHWVLLLPRPHLIIMRSTLQSLQLCPLSVRGWLAGWMDVWCVLVAAAIHLPSHLLVSSSFVGSSKSLIELDKCVNRLRMDKPASISSPAKQRMWRCWWPSIMILAGAG